MTALVDGAEPKIGGIIVKIGTRVVKVVQNVKGEGEATLDFVIVLAAEVDHMPSQTVCRVVYFQHVKHRRALHDEIYAFEGLLWLGERETGSGKRRPI